MFAMLYLVFNNEYSESHSDFLVIKTHNSEL